MANLNQFKIDQIGIDHGSAAPPLLVLDRNSNSIEMFQVFEQFKVTCYMLEGVSNSNIPVSQVAPDLAAFLLGESCKHVHNAVIVPSSDYTAALVSYCQNDLESSFNFMLPTYSDVRRLSDKCEFIMICRELGVDAPESHVLSSEDQIADLADELPVPGILKPLRSGDIPKSLLDKVEQIKSITELVEKCRPIFQGNRKVLYQELIPGGSEQRFFVGGFFDRHVENSSLFVGQKLVEHPLLGGSTTLARLCTNEEVLQMASRFMLNLEYRGLVDMEFMLDSRDSRYKIIEINPRIGRWHPISRAANTDIIKYYYDVFCSETKGLAFDTSTTRWLNLDLHMHSVFLRYGLFVGAYHLVKDLATADVISGFSRGQRYHTIRSLIGLLRHQGLRVLLAGEGSR